MLLTVKDNVETGSLQHTGGTLDISVSFLPVSPEGDVVQRFHDKILKVIDILDHTTIAFNVKKDRDFCENFSDRHILVDECFQNKNFEYICCVVVKSLLYEAKVYGWKRITVTRGKLTVEKIHDLNREEEKLVLSKELKDQITSIGSK